MFKTLPPLMFAAMLITSTAHGAPCDSAQKYGQKIGQAVQKVCSYDQNGKIKACSKVGAVMNEIKYWADWWNSMAGDSWAKLGPRPVGYGKRDYGTLRVPGKRLWVSTGPAKGAVQFSVKHLDGDGGFKANVCTIDATGRARKVYVEEVSPQSGNKSRTFQINAADADGRFVAIDLLSRKKRFKYEIALTGMPIRPNAGGGVAAATTQSVSNGQLVALRTAHGKYLVAEQNGALNANRSSKGAWERFVIGGSLQYGQAITLRSHHGKFVVAEDGGQANANRASVGAWERWTVESSNDKSGQLRCGDAVRLKGAHNKYLVANNDGTADANRPVAQSWETFVIECD